VNPVNFFWTVKNPKKKKASKEPSPRTHGRLGSRTRPSSIFLSRGADDLKKKVRK